MRRCPRCGNLTMSLSCSSCTGTPRTRKTPIKHVTPIGGNVFEDIGFSGKEAEKLKQDSTAAIRTKLK